MKKIRIAIIGIGNCASSLIQGIHFYKGKDLDDAIGLMHGEIGGFRPDDIEVVAGFDVDKRKVGQDIHEAIFMNPNCTTVFQPDIPKSGVKVQMGNILDGISAHMADFDDKKTFLPASKKQPTQADVVKILNDSGAEILVNYLPVGSEQATRFYVECALEAGVGFINNIPVFIASNPEWAKRFAEKNIPIIGDDIKSQFGATITHRVLTDLFKKRGVKLDRTYQLNTGGNTDFLNMLNRDRLASKKTSKTEAVQSAAKKRLAANDIHVGPSDYVPWQNDNKVCFIRMEGRIFGDVPINMEMRLSVEDSPNSAGVAIDTIRCAKLALDRGEGGVLHGPSAYFCKHPMHQFVDEEAHYMTEEFINGGAQGKTKKCLIIAAGKGLRLRSQGDSKPLTPIFGVPLIERVILNALEAGANEFFVVTGYQGAPLKSFLQSLSNRLGIPITPIDNEDWEKENGLSVLKGRQYFQEPFLLLMADHLFDPQIARELMAFPLANEEIVLAVDQNKSSSLVDMQDVTRVITEAGNIKKIGKGLENFDAFDTGIFFCRPVIFKALEQSSHKNGNTTLSGAIQILAEKNQARTFDIGGRFWIDVDDPAAFKKAENALLTEIEDSAKNDSKEETSVIKPVQQKAEKDR
ncbi:Inositol-1-phosphate synthase [hydrothermal vent metagenome]|uniref:Inositol-1-phosphate synthase n=1 Tax=hydrothermal vent metagenome TaxID=652676 RepID=A0A3B1D4V8_9ZZZZ